MDFIEDENRRKYRENLRDLESKVNPKPYSESERERIIREKLEARNRKMYALINK